MVNLTQPSVSRKRKLGLGIVESPLEGRPQPIE